jgi:hypothetical protein
MERHLDQSFGGRRRTVFREVASPIVHLEVRVVEPSREWPSRRLVTCGMAAKRMTTPSSFEYSPYAELSIALPRKTKLRNIHWAAALLTDLARSTHRARSYLWDGHTVGWPEPIWPGTPFSSVLVITPYKAPEGFEEFECGGRTVNILGVFPLHDDELELCHPSGVLALHEGFVAADVDDVVDLARPSVMKNG